METLSEALDRVTKAVGAFKSIEELERYIDSLPHSLKTNAMLNGLFDKRKLHLKK